MNRARLNLAIRLAITASAFWLLGMPLPIVTLVVPVALLPSVLPHTSCPDCCYATGATIGVAVGGIANSGCTNCNDFNTGVVSAMTTCGGGGNVNVGAHGGCAGCTVLTLGASIFCSGSDTTVSAQTFNCGTFPTLGSAGGHGTLGPKPYDCRSFTINLTPFGNQSFACDFSAAIMTVTVSP
jgi:hypothetical protein